MCNFNQDHHYDTGSKIILEADIIILFGQVNNEILLSDYVFPKLPDKSLNDFVDLTLIDTLETGHFQSRQIGTNFELVNRTIILLTIELIVKSPKPYFNSGDQLLSFQQEVRSHTVSFCYN